MYVHCEPTTAKRGALSPEELRATYQEVYKSYRTLETFRAKLLLFLPLISGMSIIFLLYVPLTGATKSAFAPVFLGLPGLLGCIITFCLFVYEFRNIKKCNGLMAVGQQIEVLLNIDSNRLFIHWSTGLIERILAACIIYSAVLAAWIFVTLVFMWPQGA